LIDEAALGLAALLRHGKMLAHGALKPRQQSLDVDGDHP